MPTTAQALDANIAVVVGTLSRPPERRTLPNGETVLGLEVNVRAEGAGSETVNVAWYDAPAAAERWLDGEQLLVTGRTRRRFFRVAGRTESRTEVVAAVAVPTRRVAAVRRALEAAAGELLGVLDP
jgi:single-stranded DNA-binding protein